MDVRWTATALVDLDRVHDFIAEENVRAAATVADKILEAVEYLETVPNIGRPGRLTGTREVIVTGTPLIVIYRIQLDEVHVLRVLHHSRRWPD